MDIRPFTPADRDACLAMFHVNTTAEHSDLVAFLNHPHCPYFVMEHDAAIVGCGGFTISGDQTSARLVWGMIRQDLQRQGLGRYLLMFRLREIGKLGSVQMVHTGASNDVARFFEKQGFRTLTVSEDREELVKKLTVCA